MSPRPRSRLPVRDAVSAGGVVWRRSRDGGIEVVVGRQHREKRWALPKGTPDPGEALEDTAIREVEEETGLRVTLGVPLGAIEYWFQQDGRRVHKRVHHWLMTPDGGDLASHDAEFDDVRWLALPEAREQITFATEREVLDRAAQALSVAER